MNYLLDKQVKLNTETSTNLYQWCIDEVTNKEAHCAKDQIPWRFSSYFHASSLRLSKTVESTQSFSKDGERSVALKDKSLILGTLKPGIYRNDENHLSDVTRYSMFGTDEYVELFYLSIQRLEDDSKDEGCYLWATPSYETDFDFKKDVVKDQISVDIYLKSQKFNEFVRMIEIGAVQDVRLILRHIDGFYTDWSPLTTTNLIKVLTEYHKLENENTLGKPLPIVGDVGEFILTFTSSPANLTSPTKIKEAEETEARNLSVSHFNEETKSNDALIAVVAELKKPLWWILFALVLLLLK